MNKFVIKTTKTFKYDDKGFLIEEVVLQEEYTEEIEEVKTKTFGDYHKGGYVREPWTYDHKNKEGWKKAKGPKQLEKEKRESEEVYGKRSDVGNSVGDITVNVDNKNINDIMSEIKARLEKEIRTKGV